MLLRAATKVLIPVSRSRCIDLSYVRTSLKRREVRGGQMPSRMGGTGGGGGARVRACGECTVCKYAGVHVQPQCIVYCT